MTLTTPYSATFIVGDGETKTFSYLFDEVSENFISVIVYDSLTGISTTPTYIIDTDQKQVIFGDDTPAPTAVDVVCIYRNTPVVQDVQFRTLHGYDAKTMENILSKIVAMIQEIESKYLTTDVLQGDPWQIDLLSSADDGATLNIDYTAKKFVKGLYFRITSGNLQVSADGSTYITMPKSTDVAEFRQNQIELPDHTYQYKLQYRVGSTWYDADVTAQGTADAAYQLAETLQADLSAHVNNQNNPHQTSVAKLTDVDIQNILPNQFLMFDGLKWKNVNSSATASWGTILGTLADQTDLKDALDAKVNIDGSSIMTAPLKFASGSMRGAVGPYLNGLSFWKMDSQYTITNIANLTDSRFLPVTTNSIDLGRTANTWKDLYLGGKAYVATLNNGADLAVPNKSGTLATMGDVELAAQSGRMLTDQGVWYAKMYAGTTPPAAEDDTNYADFSQVDQDNNPIIVIYTRTSGAWVQSEIITPPAEYDGYVPITSKIWDIAEQTGQQGGRVLWNHVSKEFTPYPTIISFEDAALTGTPTAPTPDSASPDNQIATKEYVDNAMPSGGYHPDLFDWKWADHQVNDVQWLRADTFSWQSGAVYEAAFNELFNDIYKYTTWYLEGEYLLRTYSPTPSVGDQAYLNSEPNPVPVGLVQAYDSVNNTITVNNKTYAYNSNQYVTPVTETVAGITVTYYPGTSGRKIVAYADMTAVESVYTATGVAWYYIIDVPDKRFKLPRTKFGVTGYRDGVGNYVAPGVPNITGTTAGGYYAQSYANTENTGAFSKTISASSAQYAGSTYKFRINTFDASLSNSVYGNSTTVQPPATQMYLYFYVGEFTQTAIENTAGLNAELFNDKVDVGHEVIAFQAPTAGNNYTWYRKYADGWIEQGGYVTGGGAAVSVSLPVTMSDANYHIELTGFLHSGTAGSTTSVSDDSGAITTTGFKVNNYVENGSTRGNGVGFWWEVKGMSA